MKHDKYQIKIKKEKTVASILGICAKAGKLTSGEDGCLINIRNGNAHLILIASDASDNSIKMFSQKCDHYGIKVMKSDEYNKEMLGKLIGKSERSAVAILDEGFATEIEKIQGKADCE